MGSQNIIESKHTLHDHTHLFKDGVSCVLIACQHLLLAFDCLCVVLLHLEVYNSKVRVALAGVPVHWAIHLIDVSSTSLIYSDLIEDAQGILQERVCKLCTALLQAQPA